MESSKRQFRVSRSYNPLTVSCVLALALVGTGAGCSDSEETGGATGGTGGTSGAGGTGAAAGAGATGGSSGTAGSAGSAGAGGAAGSGGQSEPACKPPDTVPDPWKVIFRPYDLDTGGQVEGALLEVYLSDGTLLDSGTSDDFGEVSLSIPTGGKPIDGYFMASKDGYMPTRFRIQGGLGWFESWSTMMAPEAYADAFVAGTWAWASRDPDTAMAFVGVIDCNQGSEVWGLKGATLSFEPAGTGSYYYGETSTPRTGFTIAANIPAGDNTLTVSLDGVDTTYDRPMLANTWEALLLYPKATPDCQPADTSSYVPAWKPSNGLAQGLCTDEQVEDYISVCMGQYAHTVGCDTWKADPANAACLGCAMVDVDDSNWNALINFEQLGFIDRDMGSCISAFEDDLSESSCGAKYQAATGCVRAACAAGCPVETASSTYDLARFNECANAVMAGDCSAYWDDANACTDSLLGQGDPVDQCIWDTEVDDFASLAERSVKLTCGDGSAEVGLMGKIKSFGGDQPEGVEVCWHDNDAIPCALSAWKGSFTLEGMLLHERGALKMTMTDLLDTYWWTVAGAVPDGLIYRVLTTAAYSQIHQDVGETEDATLGMLTVRTVNNKNAIMAGSTVGIDSASAAGPYYFNVADLLDTAATSSPGTARYLRVPPGDVEIRVKSESGKVCRARGFVNAGPQTFPVYANANSEVFFVCDP